MHVVGPVLMENWIDHPNVTAVVLAGLPGQESGTWPNFTHYLVIPKSFLVDVFDNAQRMRQECFPTHCCYASKNVVFRIYHSLPISCRTKEDKYFKTIIIKN